MIADWRAHEARGSRCIEFIVVTGYPGASEVIRSARLRAFEYLEKPIDPDHLADVVWRARAVDMLKGANIINQRADKYAMDSLALEKIGRPRKFRNKTVRKQEWKRSRFSACPFYKFDPAQNP